jgi:hypothetical protein
VVTLNFGKTNNPQNTGRALKSLHSGHVLCFRVCGCFVCFYPPNWECILMHWGTPVYGNAFPNTRVPQYMGMHSHILGYSDVWECIPIYWGTPVYGDAFPYTGVSQYMGMYSHMLGYPSIWERIPIFLGSPQTRCTRGSLPRKSQPQQKPSTNKLESETR